MEKLWETCGHWTYAPWTIHSVFDDDDLIGGESVVTNYAERADDLVRAVSLLRERGMSVSFPMQTADGEMIFAVDKDFTLTAHEMLELLESGELHAEGVRKLVEGKAATLVRRQAASS